MSKDAQHSGLSTSEPRSRQSRLLPAHRHKRPASQSVQSPHTPRRPAHPRNSPGSSQCPVASNSDSSRLPVWGQAHPRGHCFSHTPGGRAAFQGGHRSPTDSLTPAGPAHGYGHSHRPKCPCHQGRPSEQRVRLWGQPQPTLQTVTASGVHQDSPTPTGRLQLRDAPQSGQPHSQGHQNRNRPVSAWRGLACPLATLRLAPPSRHPSVPFHEAMLTPSTTGHSTVPNIPQIMCWPRSLHVPRSRTHADLNTDAPKATMDTSRGGRSSLHRTALRAL